MCEPTESRPVGCDRETAGLRRRRRGVPTLVRGAGGFGSIPGRAPGCRRAVRTCHTVTWGVGGPPTRSLRKHSVKCVYRRHLLGGAGRSHQMSISWRVWIRTASHPYVASAFIPRWRCRGVRRCPAAALHGRLVGYI